MRKNNSPVLLTNEIDVGYRLREIRTERGLSIRALAERSGLNVNTLSMIENGKTSPSVSTLQLVAAALNTPMTAFFETETPEQEIVFQKKDERRAVDFSHGRLADLGIGFTRQEIGPFLISLAPKADSGKNPIVHTGSELVFCLEGQIRYEVNGDTFILDPGDSLLFEARLPHRWLNPLEVPSRSLLLLCPADERDDPNHSHFSANRTI